jgi:ketosteroid isomerase-like protein
MVLSPVKPQEEIVQHELDLLRAFEMKDITALNALIHNNALFVLPNGLSVTKETVLNNYREGNAQMASLVATDRHINVIGSNAVVSFNLEMKGKYFDKALSSNFRYLRVWQRTVGSWQVIATSGVQLVESA